MRKYIKEIFIAIQKKLMRGNTWMHGKSDLVLCQKKTSNYQIKSLALSLIFKPMKTILILYRINQYPSK